MTITQRLGRCSHLPGKAMIITQPRDLNTPVQGVLTTTKQHCAQSSRLPECPTTITHQHDQVSAQQCQTTDPLPRQESTGRSRESPPTVLTSSTHQNQSRKMASQHHSHHQETFRHFTTMGQKGRKRRW